MVRSSLERNNIEQPRRTRRHREVVRRPIFRPIFENLEVRITPTTRIWSGALNNLWTQGANWTGGVAPSSGDDLLFPATASQHTAANDFANGTSFASITIADSSYDLIGNAINLTGGISTTYTTGISLDEIDTTFGAAGAGISVSSGGELDFVGVLAGLGGMTLSGGGTLNLTGINANSYTGTTTVNAGTLLLSKTGGVAIPGGLVVGNGIGTDLVRETASNQIADSSNVTVNSSSTLDFNGNNDLIGGLTVVGGSVMTKGGNLTLGGVLTMTGGSVDTQAGLLTLGADVNTNAASTTATISGNLDLGGVTRTFTVIDNPATDPDLSISANISGTGAGIIKAGANSRLALSGNNTYDGATNITAGILSVSSANALGATSAGTTVTSGATLELETGVTLAAEPITINGPGFGSLGAIWNANGTNTITGLVTLGSGSGIGVMSGQLTISGQITDGGSGFGVTKVGFGTLALSNANPYTGMTNITAGVVQASNSGSLGTGAAAVASGAELDISGGITLVNSAFTIGGSGVGGNGVLRSSGGFNTISSPVTLSANSSIGSIGGSTFEFDGAIGDGGNAYGLTLGGGGSFNFGGSGANTYTGATTVNAGTLNLNKTAGTNAFGGNLVIGNGAITPAFVVQGNDNQVPDTSSISLNGANAAYTLTGATKEVVNGLTLDGGTVTIGSGNLDVGSAGITTLATLDAPATITSGTTGDIRSNLNVLNISVADTSASPDLTLNLKIGSATGLSKTGAGTLLLSGSTTNAYAGTTTVNQGVLDLNKTSAAIAIPGDLVIGDVGNDTASVVDQQNSQVTNSTHVTLNGSNASYSPLAEGIAALNFNDGGTVNSGVTSLTIANSVAYNSTNASSALANIAGILDLNGNATFAFNMGSASGLPVELRVGATVQNGGFVLSGGGILALSGNNTYSGATAVNAGGLQVESNNALGASSGATTVVSGASVSFVGSGLNVAEPFSIAGTGLTGSSVLTTTSGSATLTGAVTLAADSQIGAAAGSTLTINGVIDDGSSTYNLTVANGSTGRTILGGANVFHGNVTVTSGNLQAASNNALGNSASNTNVTLQDTASLELSGAITIPAAKGLVLRGNGASGSAAKVVNVSGNNAYDGAVTFQVNTDFNVSGGTTLTMGAAIGESGGSRTLIKVGSGTLALSATNSYTGTTFVDNGALLVNGSIAASSDVQVASGATLGGSGTVPLVTVISGGTVLPGNSPGILNSGSVGLATGSTFDVQINGATVGTQYNQLAVTGTVNLDSGSTGGATLSVSLNYLPTTGTVFTIINNDASDPISGTFNGLAEGATLTIGNQPFRISYVGGTGNDVTLTALPRIDTWTGLGGDSNWSNAANWVAGVAPSAGDQLVFPANASQTTNVNNLTAGTDFDSIIIAAAGYSLNGNAITLDTGLLSSPISGSSTFSLNTTLNANQTFNVATGGTLVFSGTISSGAGLLLTKTGGGTLSIGSDNGASFNGNTTVSSGILSITAAAALGRSTTANVTVASGATLSFDLLVSPSTTTLASLTLAGTGVNGVGALVANDPIVVLLATSGIILTAPTTIDVSNGNGLDFGNSVISGAGFGFNKAGQGLLSLGGTNTYTGTTTVSAGTLWLNSGAGVRVPGNLVIDGTSGSATVRLFQSSTIANTSAVTLNGAGALLDLQSYNDTIGSLTFTGGSVTTGAGTLTLGGDVTSNAASNTATISGQLDLGGATRLFNVAQGTVPAGGPDLAVSAVISGIGVGMTKNGAGTLTLSGVNTFSGDTAINAGTVLVTNANGLGSGGGTTTVHNNGTVLQVDGGITLAAETFVFNDFSILRSTGGDNTIPGAITFPDFNLTVAAANLTTLTLSGVINGPGNANIFFGEAANAGTVVLAGNNTFNNYADVRNGTLVVTNNNALGGTTDGAIIRNGATLRLQGGVTIADPIIDLEGAGFGGQGALQSLSGNNTFSGPITLGSNSTIAVNANSFTINGAIGGSSGLTTTGAGRLVLASTSTYSGPTTVNGGNLQVDGDISASSGLTLSGGTLTGNGTTPNIVATGGTVFPGDNPGILHSGSVNLGSNTSFYAALDGATPGTGYSQLVASGPVTLGGGSLQESLNGYTPAVGDKLTIIKNNSGSPVAGTFGGLAEGSTFNVSGSAFSISYMGGASHQDVVLSYVISTNTSVSSSKASSTYGDPLIFTALVTSSGGTPNGSVLFYDGPVGPATLLGSGLLNNLGIAVYNIGILSPNGSPYAITAVYQGATLFAGSTSTPFAQTVNKALLTVTGNPNTRQYGDANPTFTYTANGFVNGETLATSDVTGSAFIGTTATPSSPVSGSPYQIMVGQGTLSSNDYNFSFTNSLLTVTPATLTVTADAQNRQYGGPNPTLTATFSGFKNGETLATSDVTGTPGLTTSATPTSPVSGSPYTINASAGTLTSGNYTFSYVNGQLSITKAALTVTADPQSRLYGDANPTLTVSYTGFKNGETLATSDLTGTPTLSATATPTSPVVGSPYVITPAPGTQTSSNYSLSYVNGQLTITPATLIVSADNQFKVYGSALPTLTATFSGFKNGETLATSDVTGSPGLTTTATSASHVSGNPYLITTATGSLASGNYTFALINGLLSVTPAPLTITADNQSKGYGAVLPTLTASYTGFVNGDTSANLTTSPTLSSTATASSNVSGNPYAIIASGAVDTDYSISYVGGQLIVTPASLTITANNATKVYGAALPTLFASFSGFVNGDTSASLTTQPSVSTTGTAASHVAGSPYAVSASGAIDSNYNITYVAGSLSVTPVALTISANNASKLYGAALPTLTSSYSGLVNGDTSASLTTQPTLNTAATPASHVAGNPYSVTASGAVDPDYIISYAGGQLSVTPVALTITADNQSNVYGAALPTLTASYSGFVNGDTSASLTTQPLLSTTATLASHVAMNPYPITSSSALDTDYTINYVSGQLTVVPAPLTITANNASKVYGSPVPLLSSSFSGFVNGDTSSSLTTQPTVSTTATATSTVAGSPYSITTSGAVDSDYAMSYVAGQLTVGQAATTVALSTSSASTIYGQPVTFTANVAVNVPGTGTPTGTVTFRDGNILLATVPLAGTVATFQISSLAPAAHGITATYNGDSSFSNSPQGFVIQTIQKGTPVATLTQSTSVMASGRPLILTVSVISTISVPVNPLGIVNFYADQTLLGQAWVVNGQATITTTLTATQSISHLIYGVYLGDQEFNAVASNQGNVLVNPASTITSTTTTLVAIPNISSGATIGSNLVATVASTSPGFGVPTGSVTYSFNGKKWVVLPLMNGAASKFMSSTNLKGKTFSVVYSGDATHAPSSSSSLVAFGQKAFHSISRPIMALARRGHVLSLGAGRQG